MTQPASFTSHMAGAADPLMEAIADMLGMEWSGGGWDHRLHGLIDGATRAGWICGLLYAQIAPRRGDASMVPVAAPVMARGRYRDAPVYFGDLVVRADGDMETVADLGSAIVAFNETTSLSGYRMLLDHFDSLDTFAGSLESGSHAESMRMVATGAADVASIDSTLLDMLATRSPAALDGLRVLASLGPYPAPPVVAWPDSATDLRDRLVRLHESPASRRLLSDWGIDRFAPVGVENYRSLAPVDR